MKAEKLINIILFVATLLVTLFAVEYVVEKHLVTKVPLKFQFALPNGLRVLAQSSKSDRLPANYIALVGDSYAFGNGDWLLNADHNTNQPFHSAHLLHELTGSDVITFGRPGASTMKGWVREPVSKFQFIHDHIDSNFQAPEIILAYFHAGNDLSDNVIEMQKDFFPVFGADALDDDEAWQHFFEEQINKNPLGPHGKSKINSGWLAVGIFDLIKEESQNEENEEEENKPALPSLTQVLVNGKTLNLAGGQSPGMDLNEQETDLAFTCIARSLRFLRNSFPEARIVVVYIPSVLESYNVISKEVSLSNTINNFHGRFEPETRPAHALVTRSNEIANRLAEQAKDANVIFIDTRADIQNASTNQMLHGPLDIGHFNEAGYRALTDSIFRQLPDDFL